MTNRTTEAGAVCESDDGADEQEPPSTRIALELARQTDKRVDELRPLAESVDPEALDDVFTGSVGDGARLTFTHEGCAVTLEGTGDVSVRPANDS